MGMEHQLCILIPAYKPDFLQEALQSIENQTDKRFQVYIGDDASPFDLWKIAQPFVERNGWIYQRFEQNLGGTNLVGHWNRCVQMSKESWVWLFSDDDLMAPDCVSVFHQTREQFPRNQVFRFPFAIIDKDSKESHSDENQPEALTGFQFGSLRFERKLLSSAVEFIFSRKAWEREGGFISFPLAWCSDDASWIAFSASGSIAPLPGGKVFWRLSDQNISSQAGPLTKAKLEAAATFIAWFNKRFSGKVTASLFGEQVIWFRLQMEQLSFEPGIIGSVRLVAALQPSGLVNWLRTFNEVYARSYCSNRLRRGIPAHPLRFWISRQLPKF